MLWIIPAIVISYLIGSIPTAYIFGRLLKGIDIRQHGSGNVGATNAMRVLGKTTGITVLLLDVLKGLWTVLFIGNIFAQRIPLVSSEIIQVISGLICVCGHNWTVFLGFKGGKGMAASIGVLLGLSAAIKGLGIILGLAVLIWLIVFLLARIVSLASLVSAVSLPVLTIILRQPFLIIILSFILSILTILRHRSNITRILQGKESRLVFQRKNKQIMKPEDISELKNRLGLLLRKEAFKKGNFVLSSGKTSNYYLDGRIVTLTPEGAYLCAGIILDRIKDLKIDALGGPSLGADPIVGAVALLSHTNKIPIKTFIVRKAAKEHGTQQQIEGPKLKPLSKVVLIDDVATTGKALIEAKQTLDKLGVVVEKAIVIVDRLEGARENLEKIGCPLESIFTIKDLDS